MVFGFFKKQLLDVIEWSQEDSGLLVFRFPMEDREIQSGAQLTVRQMQVALFINEGEIADLFGPGRHTLVTNNLPMLTSLKNWELGFKSPFKSDLYFFSMKEQIDQKWGTATPITVRDKDFGVIRIRAYGNYTYRIKNPKIFFQKIMGTKDMYLVSELEGQLKSIILTNIATHFGKSETAFLDMAGNQEQFSIMLKENLKDEFENYGLSLENFLVQSISLPEEVQNQIDKISINSESVSQIGSKTKLNLASQTNSNEEVFKSINQLYELKVKGILSEQEFESKKSELMKKIT